MADNDAAHKARVLGGAPLRKAPPPVRTPEEALRYAAEMLDILRQKRLACNVVVPGDMTTTVAQQKRAERAYLMHVGRALEACNLLCAFGLLEQRAFEALYQEALDTLAPTVTGSV